VNRRKVLAALGLGAFALGNAKVQPANALEVSGASEVSTLATRPTNLVYVRDSIVYRLPRSRKRRMAWTVDDGTSVTMINAYVNWVKQHNLRLTFFVYSDMHGWRTLAGKIRPLVETGQIQIANHTARHPDLTKLSTHQIQKELWDCHKFIMKHYGVDARPYFRPPYGAINHRVVKAAAAIGYTKPIMWSGTLADATRISTYGIWNNVRQYMGNEVIMLAHANNTQTSHIFGRILRRIRSKHLTLVTLQDAMSPKPQAPSVIRANRNGTSVVLSWSTVTNAQFYDISFWEDGVLRTIKATRTIYTVANLDPGRTYVFHVAASVFGVKSGASVGSNIIKIPAITPSPSPSASSPTPDPPTP
jgi:peptidoglycan/xylan/chitin deacetylase (PgdA/CDA1 family)